MILYTRPDPLRLFRLSKTEENNEKTEINAALLEELRLVPKKEIIRSASKIGTGQNKC